MAVAAWALAAEAGIEEEVEDHAVDWGHRNAASLQEGDAAMVTGVGCDYYSCSVAGSERTAVEAGKCGLTEPVVCTEPEV